MWIVRLALRRPYTFAVMALLMLVLGIGAIVGMRKDIFPFIDIPVVSVVWSYTGMPPQEMADRIVTIDERAMTTTVNDIEHMESTSYPGVSVIKVYLQPGTKVETAISEITALSQTILRPLPPGIFAPNILQYDASSVPIIQLALNSDTLSQQELYDQGQNFIRTQLATIQGASIQLPLGGATPQVMVDLDPASLYARGLSASDVSNALAAQNLIVPAGTAKIGMREYQVQLNSSPLKVEGLNALPIKLANGSLIYMRDVAQIKLGHAVQTNIVRQDGKHGVLLTIVKHGETSTLDIVSNIKKKLATIGAEMPPGLHVEQLFDQSVFVRAAMNGVLREGAIAALLTGLMILLFLGSWRSTLIVFVTIPLSILTSLGVLALFGQTINIMTLGGLSLAVGVLVDDATVEVENIHRNLDEKKPLVRAILDGAQQIAVPAFVSTLSICIVFVPVLLLTGVAKYLFTPLAGAVVFAMLTSYLLSRTLIPTMIRLLLPKELENEKDEAQGGGRKAEQPKGIGGRIAASLTRFHERFEQRFERLRERYKGALGWSLDHRGWVLIPFLAFVLLSGVLVPFIGRDFFPYVDSGQMRLHVRAPAGTRIEETEQVFAAIEREIRERIPASELQTILDDIGLPTGSLNLATGDVATLGSADGEILISLKPGHRPSQDYERDLREDLAAHFPDETFFFQAANITNQILNFGLPAPIDVQVTGREKEKNLAVARRMMDEIRRIPGAVDVHLGQETDTPTMGVDVDRDRAQMAGLTQKDVANSVLISLSSTSQIAPTQWLDQENGVSYQIAVQTPQARVDSLESLRRTPITASGGNATPQLLGNLATMRRTTSTAAVSHYNVQPVYDIYASTDRRDLGGVASEIEKIVARYKDDLPKGTQITTRGEVDTMNKSFLRLEIGLVFAILFVYLLIVVNFQSWMDPLIMLAAVPGALAGVLWMLFLTMTTFSVPSLMGAIMAIGVATANSILMIVFAEDERRPKRDGQEGDDDAKDGKQQADTRRSNDAKDGGESDGKEEPKSARDAALAAGYTRMRPVIMTALAMVLGMLPMALGLGEGGEQNAPLGRAVIGGLLVATVGTLFIVPVLYGWLRKEPPRDRDREVEKAYHEGEDRHDRAPDGAQAA